jgi:hypothetical protein
MISDSNQNKTPDHKGQGLVILDKQGILTF